MLELTTYTELEIAHRLLTSYAQKCRHLHGHRYQVEITVASPSGLNKDGMIVDFKQLKEVVKEVLDDKWDHGACFNKADRISVFMLKDAERDRLHIIDANPTLEWMVGRWVEDLNAAFRAKKIDLIVTKLIASETAKNTVTWTLDEKNRVFADKPAIELEGLPEENAPADVDEAPDSVEYLTMYLSGDKVANAVMRSALKGVALVTDITDALTEKAGGPVVLMNLVRL